MHFDSNQQVLIHSDWRDLANAIVENREQQDSILMIDLVGHRVIYNKNLNQ